MTTITAHSMHVPVGLGSAVTRGRLRLTRRGRAVILTAFVAPLIAVALAAQLNGGVASATNEAAAEFDYMTVQGGQSLWQLAVEVAPAADPREVIADLMALNRLESSAVEPGQRLAIPAEYSR